MARTSTSILLLLEQLETEATLYLEHKELAMITELCRSAKSLFWKRLSSTRVIHVMIVAVDADHLFNIELAALSNSCIAHQDLTRLLLRNRKEIHINTVELPQAADSESEGSESTISQPDAELWRAFFAAREPFRSFNRSR